MKSIYLAGGKVNNTAVNIMKQHLEGLGHRVTRDAKDPLGWEATLRWGISYHGNKPALNARVNSVDKLEAFTQFRGANIRCPQTLSLHEDEYSILDTHVLLARKRHHVKGKDIVICKTLEDVERICWYQDHDFFSVFIPTDTEYRCWVFQDKAFAIYEKVYKGEGEYEGFMRNHRFGFKFEKRDDLRGMDAIEVPCIKAVRALNMDWGAVDILKGKDGKLYVLEVNSMPHIDSGIRASGIRLAACVHNWAEAQ